MKVKDGEVRKLITEIRSTEKVRAQKLAQTPLLTDWVKKFRKKYISDGFLIPLYAWDGRHFRPRKRISEFGDFILPYETVGKVFHEETHKDWIHQESMWFWEYLVSGQQIIFAQELSKLTAEERAQYWILSKKILNTSLEYIAKKTNEREEQRKKE
ncbi:hypothetical protein ACFLXH_06535 [Chloroflexota bacterium]